MHVFETRTETGSVRFSLLTCLHTTAFALPNIFSPLEMCSETSIQAAKSKTSSYQRKQRSRELRPICQALLPSKFEKRELVLDL